jgi:RNA polymerase sigma-70 factor (ECF subfamily)
VSEPIQAETIFEQERPRLVGLAYRLLGSLADAEDVVQDAWFRWERTDHAAIERPQAWLTTVVGRLGLDRLRARQRDQADYVGPWLPEPIVHEPDPAELAELSDSLTTAFLLLLERLSPVERLVLLLADVFDEPFAAVAEVTGTSEAAARQAAVRARRKLRDEPDAREAVACSAEQREVATRFLHAAMVGDRDALVALLHPDVVGLSDGGPRQRAARRPIVGAHRVERWVLGSARQLAGLAPERAMINGAPGVVLRRGRQPVLALTVEVRDQLVHRITVVVNPDKLHGVDHPVDLV